MMTSDQYLSQARQIRLAPFENSSRTVVGYAEDLPDSLNTGMHSHPKAQLLHPVSGTMRVRVTDAMFTVPPTTALLVGANVTHSVETVGIVAHRQLFMQTAVGLGNGDGARVVAVSTLLREVVVAICAEGPEWGRPDRARPLAELATDEMRRADALPFELPLPRDPRVRRITEELATFPGDRRRLGDWSDEVGTSERTLARLFVRETGMTFQGWRRHFRLITAYAALRGGSTSSTAAQVTGYNSVPAFGAAFRAYFGRTPGGVRPPTLAFAAGI